MKAALHLMSLLVVPACADGSVTIDGEPVLQTGSVTNQTRSIDDFTKLEAAGSADVRISVGTKTSLRVSGPKKRLEHLETVVEDGTLRIRQTGHSWGAGGTVTVTVTTPTLLSAEISGSGDLDVKGLTGERFELESSGSGDVDLGGTLTALDVETSGSGDLDAAGLAVQTATVSSSGSGDLDLKASKTVTGRIAGSGDLDVRGGARCEVESSGSGDVNC